MNFIYPADYTFQVFRKMDFNRAEPTCYRTNFFLRKFWLKNGAFLYIVLRVRCLTYT